MDFGEVDWAVDKQAQELNNRLFADFTAVTPEKISRRNQSHVQTNLSDSTKKTRKHTNKKKTGKKQKTSAGVPQFSVHHIQQNEDSSKQGKKIKANSDPKQVSTVTPKKAFDKVSPRKEHKKKKKLKVTSEESIGSSKKRKDDMDMKNISNVNIFKKKRKHDQGLKSVTPSKKQKIEQLPAMSEKETSSTDNIEPKKKKKRRKKKNSNKKNKYAHLSPNYQQNEINRVISPTVGSNVKLSGQKDNTCTRKEEAVDTMKSKNIIMNHNKKKTKPQQTTPVTQQKIPQELNRNGSSLKSPLEINEARKTKRKKLKKKIQEEQGIDKKATDDWKKPTQVLSASTQSGKLSSADKPCGGNKKRKFNLETIGRMLEEEEMESVNKGYKQKVRKLNEKQNNNIKDIGKFEQNTNENWDKKALQDKNKSKKGKLNLVEKMQEKLKAARFRYLNEQLYTQTGKQSLDMFKEDPEAFHVYHDGFRSQVSKWPTNPVDIIIKQIQGRPTKEVVADFGCGDAQIARTLRNKVHSFDLTAINKHVTVCDMAQVPLKDNTVDVAVFCLSLMGNNLTEFLQEANRVLKKGGLLKIAEVTSRFKKVNSFIKLVEKLGFSLQHQDSDNKMFLLFDFKKTGPCTSEVLNYRLDPCIYKRR